MSRARRQTYGSGAEAFTCDLRITEGRLVGSSTQGDDEQPIDVAARRLDPHSVRLDLDGRTVRATVARDGDTVWVAIEGRTIALTIEEPGAGAAHHAGEADVAISPMTGTLAKLSVAAGQAVVAGSELFVVEAMKMEYVVRAPRDVTVAETRGAVGEQVEQGHVVVAFEEPA